MRLPSTPHALKLEAVVVDVIFVVVAFGCTDGRVGHDV